MPLMQGRIAFFACGYRNFERNRFKTGCQNNEYVKLANELDLYGFKVDTLDVIPDGQPIECCICFDMPSRKSLKAILKRKINKRVIVLREAEMIKPDNYNPKLHLLFDEIFTWKKNLVDEEKYFYLPTPKVNLENKRINLANRETKSFVIINKRQRSNNFGELYSEREKLISSIIRVYPESIDIFGKGWDKYIFSFGKTLYFGKNQKFLRNYQGSCADKVNTLSNYIFAICYENYSKSDFYVSEKIFDAFLAGCIPIYSGPRNIEDLIPKDCFIHANNFANYDELIEYASNISAIEIERYHLNIERFLNSSDIIKYTNTYWRQTLIDGCIR